MRASVVSERTVQQLHFNGAYSCFAEIDAWQSHNPLPKPSQTPAATWEGVRHQVSYSSGA